MDSVKIYDKIRTRIVIRNFIIATLIGGLAHYILKLVFSDPIKITEILSQGIILGIVFIFLTYNMFKRIEILNKIKNLSTQFPNTNPITFYGILFSRLENSRYEDQPDKAVKRIQKNFASLFLKLPELNAGEVKEILSFLNS